MAKTLRPELRYTGTWWFEGSETEWFALPLAEREARALAQTSCKHAFPSWGHSDCCHTDCRIARGELPAIAMWTVRLTA